MLTDASYLCVQLALKMLILSTKSAFALFTKFVALKKHPTVLAKDCHKQIKIISIMLTTCLLSLLTV